MYIDMDQLSTELSDTELSDTCGNSIKLTSGKLNRNVHPTDNVSDHVVS
jgi:hypothetical protein